MNNSGEFGHYLLYFRFSTKSLVTFQTLTKPVTWMMLAMCLQHSTCVTYHMQANQCAMRAKVAMSSNSTAAPYSEYLSIFLATLTSRNSLAVFSRPMSVVVWNTKTTQHCSTSVLCPNIGLVTVKPLRVM